MSESNDNSLGLDNLSDDSKTIRECTGFTQINNNVINNIKDGDAFLVWCYLYSKTSNWKTIKQNVKNIYCFGDAKIKKIFSYLNRCGLIEYSQPKNKTGTFQSIRIIILNGSKFNKNEPYCTSSPVGQETAPPVNRTNGNDGLRNTDITKERKKPNKDLLCEKEKMDSSLSSSFEYQDTYYQPSSTIKLNSSKRFEEFWSIYPSKKNKNRARAMWENSNLDEKADLIIDKLKIQIAKDRHFLDGYAPNPSSYINDERWEDEITAQKKQTTPNNSGSDALSRIINKHLNKGNVYDNSTGNTIDPLR